MGKAAVTITQRHLLAKAGVIVPHTRARRLNTDRQPDEWAIRELAEHLGMPEATLYGWVQHGRLRSRPVPSGPRYSRFVHADATTIAQLKEILATPRPWRRRPPPVDPAHPVNAES